MRLLNLLCRDARETHSSDKFFCIGLLLVAALPHFAGELVRNGSFETEGNGFAANWEIGHYQDAEGTVVLETRLSASGKNSVRLVKSGEKGVLSCIQNIPLERSSAGGLRKLEIDVSACADKAAGGQLVFITYGADRKVLQWIPVFKFDGTFDFKRFHNTIELHPEAVSCAVSFRAPRPGGILWIDDVSVDLTESGTASADFGFDGAPSPVTGLPEPWAEKKYIGNENVSSVSIVEENGRKTAVQKYTTGGPFSGFAAPLPAGLVKEKYIRLSGAFRTLNGGTVKIGLEFFDRNGNSLGELLTGSLSSDDWKDFSGNFTVPANAVSALILLLNTGRTEVRFGPFRAAPGTADQAIVPSAPAIQTKVYPVDHSIQQQDATVPEFNTFTNSPTKLTFHFTGDKSRMKKPTLHIDLPAEVKIADAICPHPNVFRQEKFAVAPVTRPEGEYRRWTFVSTMGMQMAGKSPLYQRRLVMLLMPEKEGTVFIGKKVFYQLENDGAIVQEGSFNLNVLPALPETPNPKRFVFQRWNDEDLTWNNPEAFLASLICQEEANYIWATRQSPPVFRASREILESRGWNFFLRGTPNNSMRFYSGVKEMEVEKAVQANGSVTNRVCPSFLTFNEEFFPIRDRIIEESITSRSPKAGEYVMSDNEQWEPMDWCFCSRCRETFAKWIDLPTVPDVAEIRGKYRNEWRDFRLEHERRLVEAVYKCAKKHDLVYGDYDYVTDYSRPDWKNRFFSVAKDARLNEEHQDFHLMSYYHFLDAGAFDMLTTGARYLKKPCIPIFAIDGPGSYLSLAEVLNPARFRMMLLTAAVTGCKGASIYPGERMDGKFYIAADQAMAEIAALEDFFLVGKEVEEFEIKALPFSTVTIGTGEGNLVMEWPRWNNFFRSNVRKLGGKKLISLLNYHPEQTAYVRIMLPASGEERCFGEYITHGKITLPAGEQEVLVAVPPRDARMIVVGAYVPTDFSPMPPRESVLADFEREKADFNSKSGMAPIPAWKEKDCEFSYSDLNSDGVPEAVLRNGELALTIDPAGGRIVRLELDGKRFPEGKNPSGFIAESKLWFPKEFRNHLTFEKTAFVSAVCREESLTAELQMSGNPLGLEVRRIYTLKPDSRIEIETRFHNAGETALTVIPWTRSVFNWSEGSRSDRLFGQIEGRETELDRSHTNCKVVLPLFEKTTTSAPRGGTLVHADLPVLRQVFPDSGIQIQYRPDEAFTTAFYPYTSGGTATVEWHASDLVLAPGESRSIRDVYSFERFPGS